MMKLDSLKDVWQTYAAQTAAAHKVTENQIAVLLKARTENSVTKLKQNIYFELGVQVLTILLFGAGALWATGDVAFRVLCLAVVVVCLPFLGYFWARLTYVRSLNVTTTNLRATLRNLIEMLTGLTRLYFWTNMLLAPLGLAAGQLAFLKLGKGLNISHLPWDLLGLRLALGFVIGAVLGYFFLKWYIKKMFGDHLKALQQAYGELENLEAAA